MWRKSLAILGLLAVLALALAPLAPVSKAYTTGVAYITGPTGIVEATLEKTIVRQDVSVAANSTKYINYTLPGWVESVIVYIDNASDSVTLEALDANDSIVASATVVPLSSGYSVTLPASATKIALKNNLGSVWSGTITIVVQATIEFDIPLDGVTITVAEHPDGIYGEAQLNIRQISGPSGYLAVRELDTRFDSFFIDPTPERPNDHEVETLGGGWSETVPFRVIAYVNQPGTYTHELHVFFHTNDDTGPLEVEIASYTMTLQMNTDNTGTGTITEDDNGAGVGWKWLGVGMIAALVLVWLFRGGR